MTKRQDEKCCRFRFAALAGLVLLVACADPARVVLYDERNRTTEAPVAAAPAPRPAPMASRARAHEVVSGDTVYTVALRYQVPIRGLIKLNGLQAPYILRRGQILRLPKPRRHIVQPGDTIYRISRTYNVALSRLVRLNGIEPPYKIVVGRTLRLPDSVEPERTVVTAKAQAQSTQQVPSAKLNNKPRSQSEAKSRPLKSSVTPPSRKNAAVIPRPPPLSRRKFLLPVRGSLLSKFGPKGRGLHNDGVNIAAPRGTPVRAAENGVVVYSGNALLGFGNMILIRHANGYMTAYAHNASISVARGETVRRGQVIAKVGSSGNVSSPQLHFEIRQGKRAINPAKYLPNLASIT
jgi:murein DD-endopeptidase MepM/ murein hydrolase activator NlpD